MRVSTREGFEWVGGTPVLDFTNTVTWAPAGLENERLSEYADLVGWAREAGLVTRKEAGRLEGLAAESPGAGRDAIKRARRLREVLHEVLLAEASGRAPSEQAARRFDAALAQASARLTLRPGESGWSWAWRPRKGDDLAELLHPIAWAAAQLLTSDDRRFLKHCAADDCGWLFLDRSRNRARRWCDMKVCGNNAKARRFYHRHREAAES
jgi:predicted RNA-binding Zn ribbon-like protein